MESTFEDSISSDAGSEKKLYCIRHAQSESNLKRRRYRETYMYSIPISIESANEYWFAFYYSISTYFDFDFWSSRGELKIKDPEVPSLREVNRICDHVMWYIGWFLQVSEAGMRQIETLQQRLDQIDFTSNFHIDVCFVSPFTRTIDTALGIFKFNPSIRIVVLPDLRSHFKSAQSTGTLTKTALEHKYKTHSNISFELMDREMLSVYWIWKRSKYSNSSTLIHWFRWWQNRHIHSDPAEKEQNIYGDSSSEDTVFTGESMTSISTKTTRESLRYETKEEFASRQERLKHFLAQREEHNIVLVGMWLCEYINDDGQCVESMFISQFVYRRTLWIFQVWLLSVLCTFITLFVNLNL